MKNKIETIERWSWIIGITSFILALLIIGIGLILTWTS